jgi:hypothetical protein
VARRIRILLALGAVVLSIPASASAGSYIRLSDERTWTRSAFVERSTPVRAGPRIDADKIARLRPFTFHGRPEVVMVLGTREVGGRIWLRIRFPGLGRRIGWVTQQALSGPSIHRTLIVIDRDAPGLRVLRKGKVVQRVSVGVGAIASPTPPGRYYIRERLELANASSIYGALAFGTSAFSRYRTDWPGGGQVGIHGTNQPELIPGRPSHGCVRVPNSRIKKLAKLMPIGTPILIK